MPDINFVTHLLGCPNNLESGRLCGQVMPAHSVRYAVTTWYMCARERVLAAERKDAGAVEAERARPAVAAIAISAVAAKIGRCLIGKDRARQSAECRQIVTRGVGAGAGEARGGAGAVRAREHHGVK